MAGPVWEGHVYAYLKRGSGLKEDSCLRSPQMVVSKSCQYGGWLRRVPNGLGHRARVLAVSARSPSVSGWLASADPA